MVVFYNLIPCIDTNFRSKNKYIKRSSNTHCKCLQGFTGTLRGNESAGISNLQGLQVTCNACKKNLRKTAKKCREYVLQG